MEAALILFKELPAAQIRAALGPEGPGGVSILPPGPSGLPCPPANDQGCDPGPMGYIRNFLYSPGSRAVRPWPFAGVMGFLGELGGNRNPPTPLGPSGARILNKAKTTFSLLCAKVVYLISCSSDSNSGDEKNSDRLISKPSHKILIVEI